MRSHRTITFFPPHYNFDSIKASNQESKVLTAENKATKYAKYKFLSFGFWDCEQKQVIFGDRSIFAKNGGWENRKTPTKHNVISHAAILAHT